MRLSAAAVSVCAIAAFAGLADAKPRAKPAAPTKPAAASKAAPKPAKAPPVPVLAGVDVFGSHKVSAQDVIDAAGLQLGTPAPLDDAFMARTKEAKARIQAKFDLALVSISPISYFAGPDAGKTFVTIDLVDRGDEARMAFAPAPTGSIADPDGMVAEWIASEEKAYDLLGKGELDVGKCKGGFHCALGFGNPAIAGVEDKFIAEVPTHFKALCDLLRHDRDAKRRAAAAFLLAYGSDRDRVVAALVPSIDDPDSDVRNNVMRVLVMIQKDATEPVIPLAPVLHALHFPETTDRNKAGFALEFLAQRAPDRFRRQILAEVGDVLVEMAALSQPNNREPAVATLTALAGKDLGSAAAWRAWVDEQRKMK